MLSNEDHPGLFVFVVGSIVLCMVGVGLSLLVDRRLSLSNSTRNLESWIETDAAALEGLKIRHDQATRDLSEMASKRRLTAEAAASIQLKLAGLNRHRTDLLASRKELQKSLPALEEDFSLYRRKYREKTRAGAVGQSLGTLTARNGREFQNSVIIQVTETGLEIRHEHGTARLEARDLDQAMQDRFHWGEEEQRSRLEEKHVHPEL